MSDAWFKEQIAPDGVAEDGCHPDEAQAFQSYLNNKTAPQEAAHAITKPILSSEELDTAVLDFEIPAAREWIEVVGKELYQGAKEGKESWALSRKRDKGREDGRMNLSRWDFKEGRIRECQERGGIVGMRGRERGRR